GLDQRRKSALTEVPPRTHIWRRRRLFPKRDAARSPFRLPEVSDAVLLGTIGYCLSRCRPGLLPRYGRNRIDSLQPDCREVVRVGMHLRADSTKHGANGNKVPQRGSEERDAPQLCQSPPRMARGIHLYANDT